MINHYLDLTTNEKILLCEVINRHSKCGIEAEPETAGCFRQDLVITWLKDSIENLLQEGEGVTMANEILKTITS